MAHNSCRGPIVTLREQALRTYEYSCRIVVEDLSVFQQIIYGLVLSSVHSEELFRQLSSFELNCLKKFSSFKRTVETIQLT
jgi:hypothetical protein